MKQLLFGTAFFLFFLNTINGQEASKWTSESSFMEWNFGAAFISDEGIAMPGTSLLWGKTFINENNFILEYEAGFAFPSIVTGKIGIGEKYNNTMVTFGVRPFPMHLYTQASFSVGTNSYWIVSLEVSPLGADARASMYSLGIINFGYRWNLDK